jgi:hypothetical protein
MNKETQNIIGEGFLIAVIILIICKLIDFILC